jgi:lipopolysaccharide/colanic/teichoic acid biosynthesis glycosyltransferase/O-antigen/teichoic acid export membrane protein/membrane-associated phospholipid phosphatase
VGNLVALVLALGCVTVASLVVARLGGPAVLGNYALLRVLPWLTGVVLSVGLPISSTYHLAGVTSADPRLRPTLTVLAVMGSTVGLLVWMLAVPALHRILFPSVPRGLLVVAGLLVVTQLLTVWGKACCQGTGDLRGANLVIVGEELLFLPAYGAALAAGLRGLEAVVAGMVGGGVAAVALSVGRNAATGFFRGWGRPSGAIARCVLAFGARGQLGDLLWLVNLRLDFLILDAIAGPAVLGVYAVASKFAELMRLPATAINYVLYPRFAHGPRREADAEARHLIWRTAALTGALTPFLVVAAVLLLPVLYGEDFRAAVLPACLLLVGLSVEGAAAVSSAHLRGIGRPGRNSLGMAAGVVVTVLLDVILIPSTGAVGAAIASSAAYLVTTTVLVVLSRRASSGGAAGAPVDRARHRALRRTGGSSTGPRAAVRGDSRMRRLVDVVVAGTGLVVVGPLMLVLAVVVRWSSPGPAIFRQERVGRDGRLFTIWKFRSMPVGADRSGAAVSGSADGRATPTGRWLRATHLDELPQLMNILRGEMTIVGPRPEVPGFVVHYTDEERAVLSVRPGVIGSGALLFITEQADELDAAQDPERCYVERHLHPKLALDLAYLEHRSARVDLGLLSTTLRCALAVRGRQNGEPTASVPRTLRVPVLVVSGIGALGLLLLATRYRGGSGPGLLDAALAGVLRSAIGGRQAVLEVIRLGDPVPVALIATGLAVAALLARRPRLAVLALAGPAVTGVCTTVAKVLVGRRLAGDLCLPSGHTAAVTSLAVVAAFLVLSRRRRSSAVMAGAVGLGAVTVVAAAIGAALVAAGAHYATDTIAGYCAGLAVTLVAARLLDAYCDRRLAAAGVTIASTRAAEREGAR